MNRYTKEILRWSAIVGFGGFGAWQLIDGRYGLMQWDGDWLGLLLRLTFNAIIAGPFLAVAYFCFRRQYRRLFLVLGVVGAFALFVSLVTLPEKLGIEKYFHDGMNADRMLDQPWLGLIAMLYFLVSLFGPIVVAAWFY